MLSFHAITSLAVAKHPCLALLFEAMPAMPGSDAWWPAGECEWKVKDLCSGNNHSKDANVACWIMSASLDPKLAEAFPVYRKLTSGVLPREKDSAREGADTNIQDTRREASSVAAEPHLCKSKIKRACKFMEKCRDVSVCDYCHDEAHLVVTKPRSGHVCRSLIPQPC